MCSVLSMDDTTYTVGELSQAIGRAVARAFPDEIWVQGEMRDLNRARSGHVYFTLLDSDGGGDSPATLPVTLFASDKAAVNRILARSGAVRMNDGVQVRIRGRVTHYAQRGTVQLRMTWIDTNFTLGKLAAERDRLIKSLTSRGLVDRNTKLPIPLVPLRVGLVTSVGSAAHADFMDELTASGFAWRVSVFDARVQGLDAIGDVVRGIALLGSSALDVIALVRGGGAQTDLAVFDAEAIAVAIAQTKVPVLTGIGHETDISVADVVARDSKTPTACAARLVGMVAAYAGRVDQIASATQRAVRSRLAFAATNLDHSSRRVTRSAIAAAVRADQGLAESGRRIRRGSVNRLLRDRAALHGIADRLGRATSRQLSVADADLDRRSGSIALAAQKHMASSERRLFELQHRISLVDPALLLERGWSITRTADGAVVLNPEDVASGTVLDTIVLGGHIRSVVSKDEEVRRGR